MSIYAILEEIRNTAGKNDKISILEKNKNFPFLKEFLHYTYAPHINFFIKKLPKVTEYSGLMQLDEAIKNVVAKLPNRTVTGNAAKELVSKYLSNLSSENAELLQYMLLKDVKAGINISTINKIWPGCIFEAPYMRCELEDKAKPEGWDWETSAHYLQLKADGMFVNVIRNRGYAKLVTRQGNQFPVGVLKDLEDDLMHLHNECVYMGELTVYERIDGSDELQLLDRQTGNGILNSCLQGGDFDSNKYAVFADLWDMVNYSAWYKRECKIPYNERLEALKNCIESRDMTFVELIETHEVGSLNEAKAICAEFMRNGLEGGILKNAWMPWKDHTSKLQVKIKAAVTVELRAKALTPGSGKNAALFGSVTCESECGRLEVDVPGFTDDMRRDIHERWDTFYKDSVFSVTANALLRPCASSAKYSLFLPRFEERRMDKNVADDLEKIMAEFANIGVVNEG